MVHVYREKSLQLAAIEWMTREWGYRELAADAEATGDRMDSVGLLDGSIVAIEVKPVVHAGLVAFRADRSGSLEAKIAATLGGLYRGPAIGQLAIIAGHWRRCRPPEIGILAGEYSAAGLSALKKLLVDRGEKWRFNSSVWHWTGEQVERLFRFDQATPIDEWADADVPTLIGRQPRAAMPTLDALLKIAARGGHAETLSYAIAEATRRGYSVKLRPTGLTFAARGKRGALMSLFVNDIDPVHGINFGVDASRTDLDPDELPGSAAPRAGFLNTNRYIGSAEMAAKLFSAVVERS